MRRREFLAALAAAAWATGSPAGAAATLTLARVSTSVRRASPLAEWILARALGPPQRVRLADGEVSFGRFQAEPLVNRRAPSALVEAANVLVHEAAHYLSPVVAAQRDQAAFGQPGTVGLVVAPGAVCVLQGQPVFPSREAIPSFPPFLRESQRFGTYVAAPGDSLVTQQYGIFGLLDEFAAYHAGTRAALDLVRSLARPPRGTGEEWVAHLAGVDATVAAWPEFRGYILAWLAYARERHPDVYARTAGSAALRSAWRQVDGAYGAVCTAWYRGLPGLVTGLQRAGLDVRLRPEGVFAGRRGRRLFQAEYDALTDGLAASPALREVEAALARP